MPHQVILCVDDEEVILESLKEQLKRYFGSQYLYELANSAAEAMEILEEFETDQIEVLVIVSDCLMPGMKGDEFLVQVHRKYPHVTTIMLTGQADAGAIARAQQEANLYRCLYKPWREEELVETIRAGLP